MGRDRTEREQRCLRMETRGRRMRLRGYNFVFHGCGTGHSRGEAERKFTQNSSHGTASSTCFRRTKRRTGRDGTARHRTGRNGTSRSVPRLVRLKTVERVVPWDEI
ncbi:hypothetical protein DVH24_038889 [Malus domestica]|uniref:Uncharacterized protein n=1 Tax=Malus domestica TaxID=3750 RepID=A0A498KFS6_MALDO|nr:hypothetical protein DVH24_038889 [Malus domestica]